jgi:hypothetical protein
MDFLLRDAHRQRRRGVATILQAWLSLKEIITLRTVPGAGLIIVGLLVIANLVPLGRQSLGLTLFHALQYHRSKHQN